MAQKVSNTTTDHDTIRRWVEERGGWPAEVEATARQGQTGIIRIDFPGYSGEGKLRRIPWDEWFQKFDEANLAFVYEEMTAGGERSNFNKLVGRETAQARTEGRRTSRRAGGTRRRTTRAGARGAGARRGARTTARGAARAGGRAGGRGGRAASRGGRATAKRSTGRRQAGRGAAARTASRRGAAKRGSSRGRGTRSR